MRYLILFKQWMNEGESIYKPQLPGFCLWYPSQRKTGSATYFHKEINYKNCSVVYVKIHRYILQNTVTQAVLCRTLKCGTVKRFPLLLIKEFHGQIIWEIQSKEAQVTFLDYETPQSTGHTNSCVVSPPKDLSKNPFRFGSSQ